MGDHDQSSRIEVILNARQMRFDAFDAKAIVQKVNGRFVLQDEYFPMKPIANASFSYHLQCMRKQHDALKDTLRLLGIETALGFLVALQRAL
jgi:hypothetical protein